MSTAKVHHEMYRRMRKAAQHFSADDIKKRYGKPEPHPEPDGDEGMGLELIHDGEGDLDGDESPCSECGKSLSECTCS